MPAEWISKEEYDALGNDEPCADRASAISAFKFTSGQTLESAAAPYSLRQVDYQGTAIAQDVLTSTAFNENEMSDKTTLYAEGVNSALTEIAPSIDHSYVQSQSYSESYATKTEGIQAQDFVRNTSSPQYIQSQDNFNLNSPNDLQVNASQSMVDTIGTRNAFVGMHTMSGQTHQASYGTLNQSNGLTVLHVKGHCQIGADKLTIGGNGTSVAQPVRPRRAPPDVIAKVSGSFGSNTVSLPPAYDAHYVIQIDLTISGEFEMDSANSINPTSLSADGIGAQATKTIGDFFFGLQAKQGSDTSCLDSDKSPTFIFGNQFGDYTISNGIIMSRPVIPHQIFIINYSTSLSEEKKLVDQWLLTLTGTLEAIVTLSRRTPYDDALIEANKLTSKAEAFLQQHKNDPQYAPLIRGLTVYARPLINSMYQETEFLDSLVIYDYRFLPFAFT